MPIISEAYNYSDDQALVVKAISAKINLAPSDWDDSSLKDLKKSVKKYYRKIQDGKCCYCRKPLPVHSRAFDLEHIISRDQAVCYMLWPKNLAASCVDCNHAKGDSSVVNKSSIAKGKYPSWQEILIVHPHLDDYDDHISIIGGLYLGLGGKGARTIALCNLTRFHESALREIAELDGEDQYVELLKSRAISKKPEEKALLDTLIELHARSRVLSVQTMLTVLQSR